MKARPSQSPAAVAAAKPLPFEPARISLLPFDLDGTLVDSVGNLTWCTHLNDGMHTGFRSPIG